MPVRLSVLFVLLQILFFLAVLMLFSKRETSTALANQILSFRKNVFAEKTLGEINIDIKALPVSEIAPKSTSKNKSQTSNNIYFLHTNIKATYFYVGEPADSSNGFIPNNQSAWDGAWQNHFGGVDDPFNRSGYWPSSFKPLENPFYVALPFFDFTVQGELKESMKSVPWYDPNSPLRSQLKNRWVKIIYGSKISYAQWEDVGPYETDDFDYVFGGATPKNTNGVGAGIDVSPAVKDYLGAGDVFMVSWQFVEAANVPSGPWKEITTTSPVSW